MPVSRAGLAVVILLAGAHAAKSACTLETGPERTVARVIAVDTLLLDDGSRVRLANILAPRSSDGGLEPATSDSDSAARLALEQLSVGKAIRLRFDQARKDRYGVTRAHIMIRAADGRETWLQALLVAGGHARVESRLGERSCVMDLLTSEDAARTNALGLWTESRHRVRAAAPPRDLTAYRGTFQIVSGTVTAVESARDLTRLLFGPDRRRAFSVSFRNTDRDILGALGGDARSLIGRTLEARGWIDQRPGSFGAPDIDVSLAGHVRIVDR